MESKRLEENALKQALDGNVKDKFSYLPERLEGMEVTEKYKTLLIDSKQKSDMFNIICSTGNEERSSVKASVNHFRERALPFSWWAGFEKDPEWLEEELTAQGLRKTESELAMAAPLEGIEAFQPSGEFKVVRVRSPEWLEHFLNVICGIIPDEKEAVTTFFRSAGNLILNAKSNIRLFVGTYGNRPVATSSVHFACGVAGIYDVIVSPEMRGKGLGKAMTVQAMLYAKEQNYRTCVLTATNDAKYLYEKIGFYSLKQMWVYN